VATAAGNRRGHSRKKFSLKTIESGKGGLCKRDQEGDPKSEEEESREDLKASSRHIIREV